MAQHEFCTHSSRIDYICTRRTHADKMAKDVQLLRDFTLVPLYWSFSCTFIDHDQERMVPRETTVEDGMDQITKASTTSALCSTRSCFYTFLYPTS